MTNRRDLNYYKSLNYRIELFFEPEEKCWYAEFPELSGCLAHGATKEEALAGAAKAKDAWLEVTLESGRDIPEPRPEVEYSGRFLLRVPKSLHGKLANEARREGTSINRLAIQLLSEELERRQTMKTVADSIKANIKDTLRESAEVYAASFTWISPSSPEEIEDWARGIALTQARVSNLIQIGDEPLSLKRRQSHILRLPSQGTLTNTEVSMLQGQILRAVEKKEEERA